jgi:hypothetical protein
MSVARAHPLSRCTAIGLLVVAGCAHHAPPTTRITTSASGDVTAPMARSWIAVLASLTDVAPGVHGRADIATRSGQPATVILFLTGLQPNQSYAWHIRRAPCTATEPQGPPSEYAPLTVDAKGRGTATGTFPITDPALGAYHISVHPTKGPPIACGVIKAAL